MSADHTGMVILPIFLKHFCKISVYDIVIIFYFFFFSKQNTISEIPTKDCISSIETNKIHQKFNAFVRNRKIIMIFSSLFHFNNAAFPNLKWKSKEIKRI